MGARKGYHEGIAMRIESRGVPCGVRCMDAGISIRFRTSPTGSCDGCSLKVMARMLKSPAAKTALRKVNRFLVGRSV
jgi:hypothetical protein